MLDNLDAMYHWHYEYCDEIGVETFALVMHDIGARFYVTPGGLHPFVNASFTKYILNDLKVVDGTIASQVQLREYDYSGSVFSYGAGIDLSAGIMSLILEYTKTVTSSLRKKRAASISKTNHRYRDSVFQSDLSCDKFPGYFIHRPILKYP